jgi:magnesium chelatase subunit I
MMVFPSTSPKLGLPSRAIAESRTKLSVTGIFQIRHIKSRSIHHVVKAASQVEGVVEEAVARPVYPFTAIIGQEEMKFAALMNIIDPNIGGIMVMGDRGTGKSTTVRSLTDLLPLIDVVKDDAFMSSPTDPNLMSPDILALYRAGEKLETTKVPINMVDLPLGATEDRVCGTIDIEKALTEGTKAFEPGLLAKANRGILYVDEVNLLDDHLVDVLFDSAASGWNTVEREGISICHPARFILIGSGNPEEGELRPQLLDRFGMHAQIRTVKLPEERVKVVEERTEFDSDPKSFRAKYAEKQAAVIDQVTRARLLLPEVEIPMEIRLKISQVCAELDVDGLRGDLVTTRASRASAAYRGSKVVTDEDVYSVISLCLRHRLRKDPMATIDEGSRVFEIFSSVFGYDIK